MTVPTLSIERLRRWALASPWSVGVLAVALSAAAWTSTAAMAWFGTAVVRGVPTREALATVGRMASATTIHDVEGRVVFTLFREQRIEVPLSSMSPYLKDAVLAVEDQRFYRHGGIDLVRTVGAALANVRKGRLAEGASTITQQLARQDLISRERTFQRKLREWLVAARLEQTYSKDEILEMYLNKVYFGDGFYGVEAASRGYFGKPALELNVAEAALLAGIIRSPSYYPPTSNPERALTRRGVVLQLMRDTGALDEAAFQAAKAEPLRLHNGLRHEEGFGLYFKEAVRQELVARFGWERVSEGGLQVYSTIDTTMQQAAERELEVALAAVEARPRYKHPKRADWQGKEGEAPGYLQGSLLALDPTSGEVRAMVGGRHFGDSPFNRVSQAKRQPGSAFKPFVYAAAIDIGYTPATLLTDLDDPVLTADGEWVPEDEHLESDAITVRNALRTSSNRAAVRVIRDVGIETTVDFVQRLDLGPLPAVPSVALGAGEVSLEALTAAYAAFASGGQLRRPRLIRRVVDAEGEVLWEAPDEPKQAVSPATAFLVTSMLEDVVNAGTGAGARALGFTLPAAGKTGTTNDYADAWFVGFTPHLVAGVWVGFDQPQTIVSRGYAADLAVPIWAKFMKTATANDEPEWFDVPEGLVAVDVCSLSGQRPSLGCHDAHVATSSGTEVRSTVRTEYFVEGTEPRGVCHLHPGPGLLDRIAGVFGGGDHGAPVSMTPPPAPPPREVAQAPPPPPAVEAPPPEPPKKRGFWSRIFGRGRRDRDR